MRAIQGPAIFLAQSRATRRRSTRCWRWAADLGCVGVQIPTWDARVIDLAQAAASKSYCDDYRGSLDALGLLVTELAAPLQGQVSALHPAYTEGFQPFYPTGLSDTARAA